MSHHHHDHSHGHCHAPANFGRAFAIGITLNIIFVVLEFSFGYVSNSLSLLADAGHNLGDVLGLAAAWGASVLTQVPPTPNRSYGLKASSILAALFNATLLLVTSGGIAWEALQRIRTPESVQSNIVMAVAGVGIVINGVTAMLFFSGRNDDLNVKAAFQHMAYDALVAFGVVVGGFLIYETGLRWIDPALGLVICAVIIWGTWGLLKDSTHLALQGTPRSIDPNKVTEYLGSMDGVVEVHDLHIWGMSTTEIALTAHLVVKPSTDTDALLKTASQKLHDQFEIEHTTIQIESSAHECDQAAAHVV